MDFDAKLPAAAKAPSCTLEAYNALRDNLVEAAKHSRNLFMTHLAVQSYALIVLAGLTDKDFFEQGAQQKLPVIDASVALSWFMPALAILSLLVFVYWQMYQRKMWLLANETRDIAKHHVEDERYIPADGSFRYPWIGFFAGDSDVVLRFGAIAFGVFQWALMPVVQLACWTRTLRLGGQLGHWLDGLPWGPFFGGLYCLSLVLTWRLRVVQRRLVQDGAQRERLGWLAALRLPWLKRTGWFPRLDG